MKRMNLWISNKAILGILFLLIYSNCISQKIDVEQLLSKHDRESEIIISDELKYVIKTKKNKLKITSESYYESLIVNENGINNFTESYFDSELVPVLSHEAYTINSSNSKIKTELIKESLKESSSVFFDDVKEIEVTYKGLEPGARKILKHKNEFLDPNLLHRFLFKKHLPAEKIKLTIEVDKNIEIGYKLINVDNEDIKFTKEQKRNKTIYQWEANQLPSYKYEKNMPGILYTEPHIAVFVKSFMQDDKKVKLLGDVDDLFKYYTTFVEGINKTPNEELVSIAKEATEGLNTEEEKIKAIYYWVKDNIKYVAYENGYEGFIPREANLVCSRKFGDCKDMASIITAMCQSVDISNVQLTWIGTRAIPYTYSEMPTPAVDNHMIATYVKGDSLIFLDATDQETAYGLPSSFIQGKEALIYFNAEKYQLAKVPIISPEINQRSIFVEIHLDNKTIIGKGMNQYQGLIRSQNIATLHTLNEKKRFDGIKSKVQLGNNKFILDDYSVNNEEDRDQPFEIEYTFHLDNYLTSLENEKYFNMFMKKYTFIERFEKDRQKPYEFNHLGKWNNHFELKLINGETIVSIPENFAIDNELLEFESKFEQHENSITLDYTIKLKKLLIDPKSFDLWNSTAKEIKNAMRKTIILKTENK